jgi:small conductance mechanosensitive channel
MVTGFDPFGNGGFRAVSSALHGSDVRAVESVEDLMLRSCSLRPVAVAIVVILLPSAARAQDPGAQQETESPSLSPQVEQAEELIGRIRETDGELVEFIDQISTAEGEELELLRARIGKLTSRQHDDLDSLVDILSAPGAGGADITLLQQQGEQLLGRSSRRLRSYIQLFQTALDREAAKRPNLAPSEIQVFEHRLAEDSARLDRYYLGLIQLTDQMKSLGLDIGEEETFLERRLRERGQKLLELVELTKGRLGEYRALLDKSPDDSDLQAQVFTAEERYESKKASLLATIHMMKTRGMDHADLEVRAVEMTGEITPEALEVEVAVGLLQRELGRARAYLAERGPKLLMRLLVIAAILLAFWFVARVTRRLAIRVLDQTTLSSSKLLKDMVVAMAGRLVLLIGIIIALSQLGINLGPVLAGLGIAGFIVGFALQETLANFAAGAMILAYRPFDVGDLVEVAGVSGKVKDMNLVSTRILTPDSQTLVVPNGKIWGDVIRNVTAQPHRRIDMVFGISYEDDIPKAERLLEEIVSSHAKVLDDPEPVVKVHTLNDSSVDFVVRPWAKTDDYWDVYWDITREVKLRFDREGISIPYPQRDVHLVGQVEPAEKEGGGA